MAREWSDEVFVHESGVRGAPAVVFLQGSLVSGRMWHDHMERLRGYHCLAPDLPGFGRSNRLPWHTLEECADLIARLIETRVPAKRAHVVGLSWGSGVAHTLLERHPERVDRILIDGAGFFPWWASPIFLAGIRLLSPFCHTRPVIELLSRAVGGLSEQDKEDLRMASRQAFRRAFIEGFKPYLSRATLEAPHPALFVAGEKEVAVRPANAALAALMPNAIARYVPATPHGWLGKRPELHLEMVEAWIAGRRLPEGLLVEDSAWSEEKVEEILERSARQGRRTKRTVRRPRGFSVQAERFAYGA